MPNPFDQFDAPGGNPFDQFDSGGGNPFDAFDAPAAPDRPTRQQALDRAALHDPAFSMRPIEERNMLADHAAYRMGAPTAAEQRSNELATAASGNAADMGAAERIAYTTGDAMMSTVKLIGRHIPGAPDISTMDNANKAVVDAIRQQHPIESGVTGFVGGAADPVFVGLGGGLGAVGGGIGKTIQTAIPALRGARVGGYLASAASGGLGMAGIAALRGGLEPNPGQGRVESIAQNVKAEAPIGAAFGVGGHALGEAVGAGINAYRARQYNLTPSELQQIHAANLADDAARAQAAQAEAARQQQIDAQYELPSVKNPPRPRKMGDTSTTLTADDALAANPYAIPAQGENVVGPPVDTAPTPQPRPANDVLANDPYDFTATPLKGQPPPQGGEPVPLVDTPKTPAPTEYDFTAMPMEGKLPPSYKGVADAPAAPTEAPQPQIAPTPPQTVPGRQQEAVAPIAPPKPADAPEVTQTPVNGKQKAATIPPINEAPAPEAPARGTPPPQRTASPAEAPPPASASPSGRGVSYKLVDKSGKVLSEHATAGDAVDAKQQAPQGSRIVAPNAARQGGFVTIPTLEDAIGQALKAKKWTSEHVQQAAQWAFETGGNAVRTLAEYSRALIAKFGDAIRPMIRSIYEGIKQHAANASRNNQGAIGDVGAVRMAGGVAKETAAVPAKVARLYSEELPDALQRSGGAEAGKAAQLGREAVDRKKQIVGELSKKVDPAIDAVRKMGKTSTWLQERKVAPGGKWAIRNVVDAVEGDINAVPAEHRAAVQTLREGNLAIGQAAEKAFPEFKASGKFQRNMTEFGFDAIRTGKGEAFDTLATAIAEANRKPGASVKAFLSTLKAEMDLPGGDAASRKINQEFTRAFPKMPTDIKVNQTWREVIHARPVAYLQNASELTAGRTAFVEKFGRDPAALAELRAKVAAEGKASEPFDRMVKSLHGIPADRVYTGLEPGTRLRDVADAARTAMSTVARPLTLTMSAINNIPESVVGSTNALFGLKRAVKAAVGVHGERAALEQVGAINRAVYDWSFDKNSPIRSSARIFKNGVTEATAQQFFNEHQEASAALLAKNAVGEMRAGMKDYTARRFAGVISAADGGTFPYDRALAMAKGKGTAAEYSAFERKAAAFFTGGNKTATEGSRMSNSRVLSELFPFQSYAIKQTNQLRKFVSGAATALGHAHATGDTSRIIPAVDNLGRFLLGTGAQGVGSAMISAAIFGGGIYGVKQLFHDAKESPGNFLLDAFARGFGGPISSAVNATKDDKTLTDYVEGVSPAAAYPGQLLIEMSNAVNGKAQYRDQSAFERASTFAMRRIPAARAVNAVVGTWGLSEYNPKLEPAIKSYYTWRRENDPAGTGSGPQSTDATEFRTHMRRVHLRLKSALNTGGSPETAKFITDELRAATGVTGKEPRDIAASLNARRLLSSYLPKKENTPAENKGRIEKLKSLKQRLGDEAFTQLVRHDALLETLAKSMRGTRDIPDTEEQE